MKLISSYQCYCTIVYFSRTTGHIITTNISFHQVILVFVIRQNQTQIGDVERRTTRPIIFRMPIQLLVRNLWLRMRRRREPEARMRNCGTYGHFWFRLSASIEEHNQQTGNRCVCFLNYLFLIFEFLQNRILLYVLFVGRADHSPSGHDKFVESQIEATIFVCFYVYRLVFFILLLFISIASRALTLLGQPINVK